MMLLCLLNSSSSTFVTTKVLSKDEYILISQGQFVPAALKESLPGGDGCVSGQHAKSRSLPCSIHTQQAETLENATRSNKHIFT